MKDSATRTLAGVHIIDVDRMNLTLCKWRVQRGLSDDQGQAELISILRERPHAFVQTCFKIFPGANNDLEAKWITVAANLSAELREANDALRLAKGRIVKYVECDI